MTFAYLDKINRFVVLECDGKFSEIYSKKLFLNVIKDEMDVHITEKFLHYNLKYIIR